MVSVRRQRQLLGIEGLSASREFWLLPIPCAIRTARLHYPTLLGTLAAIMFTFALATRRIELLGESQSLSAATRIVRMRQNLGKIIGELKKAHRIPQELVEVHSSRPPARRRRSAPPARLRGDLGPRRQQARPVGRLHHRHFLLPPKCSSWSAPRKPAQGRVALHLLRRNGNRSRQAKPKRYPRGAVERLPSRSSRPRCRCREAFRG